MDYVLREIFDSYELDGDHLTGLIKLSPDREFHVEMFGLKDDPLELDYIIRCLIKGDVPDILRFPFDLAYMTDSKKEKQIRYKLTNSLDKKDHK